MAKNRLKVLKHSYPIFQKKKLPLADWKIQLFGHFRALAENSYIFIIAGRERKLIDFKSAIEQ